MSSPTSRNSSFASDPGCRSHHSRSPSQVPDNCTEKENGNTNASAGSSSTNSPAVRQQVETTNEQLNSTPPLRKVKRYSTSCPPPTKHPKYFLPNYGDLDPEEARESILTGGLFKPINFYGSCCGDSGDEENLGTSGSSEEDNLATRSGSHISGDEDNTANNMATRSSSHISSDEDNSAIRSGSYISIDSAYSSDGVVKNSPPDPASVVASSTPDQKESEGIEQAIKKNEKAEASEADSSIPSSSKGKKKPKIEARLHCKMLWKTFLAVGNEMIVTKPGR